MKLIYGTTNAGKVEHMKEMLQGLEIKLVSLNEVEPVTLKIDENGNSPVENACIKAKANSLSVDCKTRRYYLDLKQEQSSGKSDALQASGFRRFFERALFTNSQKFYHGTKANLKPGDLIVPGFKSNYGKRKKASYVYLTATLDAAIWGAELAVGEEPGRIYIVEPLGAVEDDPNLTDKKIPGNPTKSYRTKEPLKVIGEVTEWQGHPPEQLKAMTERLEELKRLGIEAIED